MKEVQKVGLVGGGLIGMSWASLFLARGLEVVVCDPREEVQEQLKSFTEDAWPKLKMLDLTVCDDVRYAEATTDIKDLAGVDFVQESGPDRIDVKRLLVKQLEEVIDPNVIMASSTSSLKASDIQRDARYPERILVAHPMNPPHLVPMVELVPGKDTSKEHLQAAESFYKRMQRVTVCLHKEVIGHLANRLTSALYREAVYIAAEGIASVEDIDKAVTYGPGMRWSFIGPHLTYHLGGGTGGYRHYLNHLGPTQEERWKDHGMPRLTEEVKDALVKGLEDELKGQDQSTLVQRRDEALVELFKLKRRYGF